MFHTFSLGFLTLSLEDLILLRVAKSFQPEQKPPLLAGRLIDPYESGLAESFLSSGMKVSSRSDLSGG